MKAEIISIGSKYVVGEASTDCIKAISVKLSALGIEVANQQSVPAESDELSSALKTALLRNDIVFTVGALGVLSTDITVETVCSAIGRKLVYMPELEKKIDSIYAERGDVMPESDLKLAIVPDNSIVLDSKQDVIPGLIIKADGKCIIMLPEKLSELKYMMDGQVASELAEYCPPVASKAYNVFGINETQIRTRLGRMGDSLNPRFSYYPSIGETKIVISAMAENGKTADDLLCDAESHVKIKLDSFIYSEDDISLQQTVVDELQKRGEKIATAESCTAGLLSKFITDVPGSSGVFDMGVSTYSAKMKEQLLGVSKESIEKYGEVSPETACEMAAGVRLRSGADYGIGITGVAGPESQEGKPVGTVYVAVADSNDIHAIVLKLGNQSREYIREYSAKTALDMVRRVIIGLGSSLGRSVPTAKVEKKLANAEVANISNETAESQNTQSVISEPVVIPPVVPVVPTQPEIPTAPVPPVTPPEELMADLPQVDDLPPIDNNQTTAPTADNGFEIQPEEEAEEVSGFEINSDVLDDGQFAPMGLPTIAELEAAAAAANNAEEAYDVIPTEPADETADEFKVGIESLEQSEPTEFAEIPEQTDMISSNESGETAQDTDKKLPWYKRLLFWFIPQKGDGKYAIVKIVRLILIVVLIVSLTMIISYYRDLYNAGNIQSKLPPHDATNTEMVTLDDGRQILANMKPYYDLNNDTVGYLTIKDIDATGPVVWRKNDNDYYLHYDFEKKKNRFGSRFADGRDVFGEDGSMSKNTTIYGHYSDETVIFGELNKYQDPTFFKEHSTIQFSTLYQQKDYKVFAVFITNASGTDVFDYTLPEFASDEEFLRFTNRIKHRTIINTGVDIQSTDSLLTLSTCSRIFKDARLVVVARAVRPGEDPNQDLNAISVNPNPLYPDIWYREVDPKAVKPIYDDETTPAEVTTEATTPTTETTTETTTDPSTVTVTLPTSPTPQVVQQPPQIQTVISYVTVPAPTTTTQPPTKAPTTTKKPTSPPHTTQPTVTEPADDDNQSSPNKHPEE